MPCPYNLRLISRDSVGGKLRQDKSPHKVHQSAKRDLTAKQQIKSVNSKA
jgi:hypothetical protein